MQPALTWMCAPSRPTQRMRSAWPVGSSLGRLVHGSMRTLASALSSSVYWAVRSVTRARVDGRGSDGVDRVGQALLGWCREHEGGSDARVAQVSPRGAPIKVEQDRVGKDAHDQVGVRGLGELVDDGRVGAGRASTERPARVTRPGSAGRRVARVRCWLPWS